MVILACLNSQSRADGGDLVACFSWSTPAKYGYGQMTALSIGAIAC
jgi:hypothetical protein